MFDADTSPIEPRPPFMPAFMRAEQQQSSKPARSRCIRHAMPAMPTPPPSIDVPIDRRRHGLSRTRKRKEKEVKSMSPSRRSARPAPQVPQAAGATAPAGAVRGQRDERWCASPAQARQRAAHQRAARARPSAQQPRPRARRAQVARPKKCRRRGCEEEGAAVQVPRFSLSTRQKRKESSDEKKRCRHLKAPDRRSFQELPEKKAGRRRAGRGRGSARSVAAPRRRPDR